MFSVSEVLLPRLLPMLLTTMMMLPTAASATTPTPPPIIAGNWTWLGGGHLAGSSRGSYGSIGVPLASNWPPVRYRHAMTGDPLTGQVYLHGGKFHSIYHICIHTCVIPSIHPYPF